MVWLHPFIGCEILKDLLVYTLDLGLKLAIDTQSGCLDDHFGAHALLLYV